MDRQDHCDQTRQRVRKRKICKDSAGLGAGQKGGSEVSIHVGALHQLSLECIQPHEMLVECLSASTTMATATRVNNEAHSAPERNLHLHKLNRRQEYEKKSRNTSWLRSWFVVQINDGTMPTNGKKANAGGEASPFAVPLLCSR